MASSVAMPAALSPIRADGAQMAPINKSGCVPLDLRVLVIPDPAQEKIGSILLADTTKEQDRWATTTGTLVAAGTNAWWEAAKNPEFTPPQPGDRVRFAKYGKRAEFKAADGTEYWIMNDEDIVGLLKQEA